MAGTPKFSKKVSAHWRRFLYGLRGASVSSTAWSSGATLRLSRPYTCAHTYEIVCIDIVIVSLSISLLLDYRCCYRYCQVDDIVIVVVRISILLSLSLGYRYVIAMGQ